MGNYFLQQLTMSDNESFEVVRSDDYKSFESMWCEEDDNILNQPNRIVEIPRSLLLKEDQIIRQEQIEEINISDCLSDTSSLTWVHAMKTQSIGSIYDISWVNQDGKNSELAKDDEAKSRNDSDYTSIEDVFDDNICRTWHFISRCHLSNDLISITLIMFDTGIWVKIE